MTTAAQRATRAREMKDMIDKGYTATQIAQKYKISERTVYKTLNIKKQKHVKYDESSTSIEIPELNDMKKEFSKQPNDILIEGYSVYDFSAKTVGKSGVIADEEFGFSRSMMNIPYINLMPPKRIFQVCKGLYNWRKRKKVYKAYRNWTNIINPEQPLYETKYHDCDTLNAVVGIAETEEDKHFTSLDACIISRAFADRFVIRHVYKQVLITKEWGVEVGDKVEEGTIYEEMNNHILNKKNEIKLSGTIIKILSGEEVEVDYQMVKLNLVLIESYHKLNIGDKLRSLTGLKVIVGNVREQKPDIIININQIISKTGKVKGSLLQEIRTNNKVAGGMRQDEILGVDESMFWGSSISITLYPILKVYDPYLLKRMITENYVGISYLKQLLLSLHLHINPRGIIKLLPEKVIYTNDYIVGSHYLWDYTSDVEQQHKKFVSIKPKGGEVDMNKFIWDYLYIPDFVLPYYIEDKRIRKAIWKLYENKGWEERESTPGRGKLPFLTRAKRGREEYKETIKKMLFPKLRKGKYLKAIPQSKGFWELEVGIPNFNEKGWLTIFREPALDEFSVWCLPVKYNPDLPKYCIRVPPEVMLAMNGDFDGDSICVMPYKSDYFRHEGVNLITPLISAEKSIEQISGTFLTNDEILHSGVKLMENERRNQIRIQNFGALRNHVAMELEDAEEHKKIFEYAVEIETIMKEERIGKKLSETRKKMRSLFPDTLRADKRESSYINLLTRVEGGTIPVEGLLNFNTRISKFWGDLWE